MADLMRSVDWEATPLGPVEDWPQSLRTALSIINASGYPMYIAWGPEFVQFYNDAYRPILGATKHPAAMGQSTRVCFAEIWDVIGPLFAKVMDEAEQTYLEDWLFALDRNGFVEECYFTFSYSPIRDESGGVGGVLVTCIETTKRVLGERRLRLLRDLAASTPATESALEAASDAAATLGSDAKDIPFALVYLYDEDGTTLRLVGSTGLDAGDPLAPPWIRPDTDDDRLWQASRVVDARQGVMVGGLGVRARGGGSWPEPVERAFVLPIARPGQDRPTGVLVAGLSPRLSFDDDYRDFLGLVSAQVATAIADARALEDERRRSAELAELDRAKTAFFSDVSHEFRTPLALVLGPLDEAIAESEGLTPAALDELRVARRNALRLNKLVNTLLDFSRIEAGRVEAAFEPTDLARMTADVASVFRSAAERAALELVVDCPDLRGPVAVDRGMWEKVVLNLVSNALRFTFEGRITVRLRDDDESVVLEVEDTGTGIPASEVGRIFERFHRVRGAQARTQEGTGIGLALVEELVKLHEGTIDVASVEGSGTTFTVRLPRRHGGGPTATPGSTTVSEVASAYADEALHWMPNGTTDGAWDEHQAGADAAQADEGRDPLTRGARILLADDNADMREYVARLLGRHWTVDAVADGRTALARAVANPPDLVLSDIMMPGIDGFELLDELRAHPRTRDVPIVLVSARAGEEARIEGLSRGADDYLTKPFSARELVARVAAHLQLAAHRRRAADDDRQRERQQAAVAELGQRALSGAPLPELLEQACRIVRDALDVDYVKVLQLLPGGAALRLVAGLGWEKGLVGTATVPTALDSQAGYTLSVAGPVIVEDLATETRFNGPELLHRHGVVSGMSVVIAGDPEPFGVLGAHTRSSRLFTDHEVAFVSTVANILAAALERRASEERLAALAVAERARASELRAVLEAMDEGVVVLDPLGRVLLRNAAAESLLGLAGGSGNDLATLDDLLAAFEWGPNDLRPLEEAEHSPLERRLHGADRWGTLRVHPVPDPLSAAGAPLGSIVVLRDVTEERRARTTREAFIGVLSHELRTPITTIFAGAKLLARPSRGKGAGGGPSAAVRRAVMSDIQDEADHLYRLVEDLLVLARFERGATDILGEPVLLQRVLPRVVQSEAARWPEARIEMELPSDLPAVRADPTYAEQIARNLLGNAIKYSEPGGAVQLSAVHEDGEVVVRVHDEGPGILPDEADRLFELFYRSPTVARKPGAGIGLFVARRLAETMGGRMWAQPRPSRGSEFGFALQVYDDEG